MNRKMDQEDGSENSQEAVLVQAETMRSVANNQRIPFTPVTTKEHHPTPPPSKEEEKISLFWRVFGGTILSISALVAMTIYNNMASSISDLRTQIAQISESRAEMIKKEEYNTRSTSMWSRIQEMQATIAALAPLKESVAVFNERMSNLSKEQRDAIEAAKVMVTQLKERFVGIEESTKLADKQRTTVQDLHVGLTALQEKSVNRDEQMKQIEIERKAMVNELQAMRERMAKIEAQAERRSQTVRAYPEPLPPAPQPMPMPVRVATSPIQSVLTPPPIPVIAPAMFAPRFEN